MSKHEYLIDKIISYVGAITILYLLMALAFDFEGTSVQQLTLLIVACIIISLTMAGIEKIHYWYRRKDQEKEEAGE